MDQDDDKFPRFSYDLVTFLDENIQTPDFPNSANAFHNMDDAAVRSAAFTAGARSIVEMLIQWREEEITNAEDKNITVSTGDLPDGTTPVFPQIFDTVGQVREISPSVRVGGDQSGPLLDD